MKLFKNFYDEASRLAEEMDIEIALPCPRSVGTWMKIMTISTFYRVMKKSFVWTSFMKFWILWYPNLFNQESRQYLTLLGDLQNRKIADEAKLTNIATSFSLDPIALKTEWINDHVIDATKPYKFLQQLAEENWRLCWAHLTFKDVYNPIHKCQLWTVIFKVKSALRTTMTQERIAGLLLPFIEQNLLLQRINNEDILREFAKSGNRRLDFGF